MVGEPFVRASAITKRFGTRAVLDGVDLDVGRGEMVVLLGPSGCGKTTLLRIVAGLERQDAGRVVIDGRDVSTAPPAARRCGIVFQSYALFPNLTVAANVAFGMDRRRSSRAARRARVAELLELIGLPDLADRHPAQLSGGQQQRVALARALAVEPAVLLLDEPLSALDAKVRGRLRVEIRQIQRRLGLTAILVTHDQEEALTMADRVAVMDAGRILQFDSPVAIYRNPSCATVADFVGSMNVLPGWRPDGVGRLARDGQVLSHAASGDANGTPLAIAFRPEDARLVGPSHADRGNCFDATLQRVEFRGPFCRVYLSLGGGTAAVPIVIDAPLAEANGLLSGGTIGDGSRPVAVHLPPEHVRVFRQDGSAL